MAIYKNGREITGRWRKGHDINESWKFVDGVWRLIWQAVRSCFGAGFWNNNKPWYNDEGWKN